MQRYDPLTALVVVDVQNDFVDPAGSLAVGGAPAVLATINSEIAMATSAGAFVVATQDWHPPSTPHFSKDGGIWPVHCVADTWGAEIHPDLALPDGAGRVRKGVNGEDGYSGFSTRDPVTGADDPDRAPWPARRSGHPSCRRRRGRDRLLREGDGPRCGRPRLRHVAADRRDRRGGPGGGRRRAGDRRGP